MKIKYLCFGEILFDCLPSGAVLGGAPLNVAYHMTKLGAEGYVVSGLGDDCLGERARREMKEKGVSDALVCISPYPTGRAEITLTDGDADYTFNCPSAWDGIRIDSASIPEEVDVLYFGTLAQRSKESSETLDAIMEKCRARHVFFDVNIRKLFFTPSQIRKGLERATILKVNDEELPLVLAIADTVTGDYGESILRLQKKYGLDAVIVTKGKKGSELYKDGKLYINEPRRGLKVADTVGAGDSLSAGFLYTYITTGDAEKAFQIGAETADFVVTQKGAMPDYPKEFLAEIRKKVGL
ncbi:MAG: carbohydrate kinase [Candidatus Ornithospirochaeta sp.]